VFVPPLAAPFSASKTALFIFAAYMLAGLVVLSNPDLCMRDGEGWLWCAILACVSVVAVSAAVSRLRYLSGPSIAFIAGGLLLFWAARFALAGNTRALLYTASAAALIVALTTVAQFFEINVLSSFGLASSDVHRMRMYSTLGNPDFVAAFLAAALPASLVLSLATRYQRAYGIASALVIALAIVLTGSRAGVLALVAATVVFMIVAVEGRAARWCVCGAVLLLCAVAGTQLLNARTAAESARGRVFIWQVTLSDTALSAAGSGPGSFEYLYPARLGKFFSEPGHDESLRFAGHERHAQNDFVEAWSDAGWLGLALLLLSVGIWFWPARRRLRDAEAPMRSTVAAAIAGVAALCVASMFDFPLHRAETWALLWLWTAVPFVPHGAPPARPRSRVPLRACGAALLTVTGSYLAIATAASSARPEPA
jgi:O-antigen ligase